MTAIAELQSEGIQAAPATMTGAEVVCEALVREGVDTLFGYPGGAVLHLYDQLTRMRGRLRHILVRHEQGAVHMAEGYAKATGRTGVVLVTSGPGATNAVTGIANAFIDSTPLVVITGQVPRKLIGNDAFQEVDTVGITRPCTKMNYLVRQAAVLVPCSSTSRKTSLRNRRGTSNPDLCISPVTIRTRKVIREMSHARWR
jgi:acetolactate synthase-1/2/3 large subunit